MLVDRTAFFGFNLGGAAALASGAAGRAQRTQRAVCCERTTRNESFKARGELIALA
jgi:hypothetical protein